MSSSSTTTDLHRSSSQVVIIITMVTVILGSAGGENVLQRLSRLERFSEFCRLVRREGPHTQHLNSHLTVFAPSNEALQAYQGPTDFNFVLNHFVSTSIGPNAIGSRLSSLRKGNPPLYVKFERLRENVLDSVLLSLVPSGTDNDVKTEGEGEGPSSHLIEYLQYWRFANFSVKIFADRIQSLGREKFPEFSQMGKFTFFLPVDSSFQDLQPSLVDEAVVRGHVVPGHAIFSRPRRQRGEVRTTSQYSSGLEARLELSVVAALSSSQAGVRVESRTLVGNTRHHRGAVTAQVLLGDIALHNGVVHLIDRPLVIMARRMVEVVTANSPRYRTFHSHLEGGAVRNLLQQTRTLLVPTNQAFQALEDQVVSEEMMRLHFLPELILEEEIKQHNVSAPLTAGDSTVWFWSEAEVLYVLSGGGVTARIVGCELTRLGVIYSLDTVLLTAGQSTATLYDQLSSPEQTQTSQTFQLGNQSGFNDLLSGAEADLTFFAPTDSAWRRTEVSELSAEELQRILGRHLLSGQRLTSDLLTHRRTLAVRRGPALTVRMEGGGVHLVTSDGLTAKIVQADILCTNGVIHLVDSVLFSQKKENIMEKEANLDSGGGSTSAYLVMFVILTLYGLKTIPLIKYLI